MALKKDERGALALQLVEAGEVVGEEIKEICERLSIPLGLSASTTDAEAAVKKSRAYYYPDFPSCPHNEIVSLIESYYAALSADEDEESQEDWVMTLAKSATETEKTRFSNRCRASLIDAAPTKKRSQARLAAVVASSDTMAAGVLALYRAEGGIDLQTAVTAGMVTQEQLDAFLEANPE